MRKINLQLNNTKIPILVGWNILKTINPENYVAKNDVVIITNATIAKLYLKQTRRMFKDYNVDSLILRDGEKYKNINEMNLSDRLLLEKKSLGYYLSGHPVSAIETKIKKVRSALIKDITNDTKKLSTVSLITTLDKLKTEKGIRLPLLILMTVLALWTVLFQAMSMKNAILF